MVACSALWPAYRAVGVPALPYPLNRVQPDGTPIQLRLRGDEYFSWFESSEGYAVVRDGDGFWKYALPTEGRAGFRAVPGARVGTADPAGLGLRKRALPEGRLIRAHTEARRLSLDNQPATVLAPKAATGEEIVKAGGKPKIAVSGVKTVKNIVILAAFSNHWDAVNNTVLPAHGLVDTNAFWNLYNQVGHTADGAMGSVRDYYLEVSYGKLTIDSVITMWVRLPREESFYHDNQSVMRSNATACDVAPS